MVYSSIPAYLDPANWQQQPQPPNHQQTGGVNSSHLLQPPLPPLPTQPHGGGGAGSMRPGSMADRARMANIPMPEAALKCPRCDSTNTKFCYFNNYSLSQPRHFCKTCRRYWTRGGALRSVPVGGGCRRNKRSKAGGSTSKSPAASGDLQTCSSGSTNSITSSGPADHMFGQGGPLRFMAPLHNFSDLGGGGETNYNIPGLVGTGNNDMNFHSLNVTGASLLGLGGGAMEQQWRLHQQPQFPFLDASAAALYPFDQQGGGEGSSTYVGQNQPRPKAPVKVEDSHHHHQHNQDHQQMSLSRQLLSNITGNDQFWSGGVGSGTTSNAWTDLSGFSSSSASHP